MVLCGAMAAPVMAGFILAATLITPGYNHVSEPLSHLGAKDRPHPLVLNSGMVLFGVLVMTYALGIYRYVPVRRFRRLATACFALFGAGIVAAGLLNCDPDAEGSTSLEERLHNFFASTGYVGLLLGTLVYALAVSGDDGWKNWVRLSVVIAGMSFIGAMAFTSGLEVGFKGLLQRFFYCLPATWMSAMAARVLYLEGVERWTSRNLTGPRERR